jgi:hypothetical protein
MLANYILLLRLIPTQILTTSVVIRLEQGAKMKNGMINSAAIQ